MATVVSDTVLQIWKSLSFQEKDTWTLMFTAALFTIAEAWKQPNCKWIKWCSIYSRKKNAVTLVTDGTWTYSGAFFRVYKCQIIMILEEGLTDFMGFPPPHCTHPKKFRPASQRWQHAVFKNYPEVSVFLVAGKNYWMDVIKIKLSHLDTGCCFPQLPAIVWRKTNMSLDQCYFFHGTKQASICS